IADTDNHIIRKVTPGGTISTIAGISGSSGSTDTGIATTSELMKPYGVAVDNAGNVYIANLGDHTIRKVTPYGSISTIAGKSGDLGMTDTGVATTSKLNFPIGVAVDIAGNVYIADTGNQIIRKVTPGGAISTI